MDSPGTGAGSGGGSLSHATSTANNDATTRGGRVVVMGVPNAYWVRERVVRERVSAHANAANKVNQPTAPPPPNEQPPPPPAPFTGGGFFSGSSGSLAPSAAARTRTTSADSRS